MKLRKRKLIVAVFIVAAVWIVACNRREENRKLSAEEVKKLNSAPQKKYPKFTLEAQKAAMQRIAEMRRKERVEGLRDKTRPADWIEIAYHGQVLDANFEEIKLDPETVAGIQESMFSILYDPVREKTAKKHKGDLKELFYDQKFKGDEQHTVRHAVIHALLAESDDKTKERYLWRHRLLRYNGKRDNDKGDDDKRFFLNRELLTYLRRERNFLDEWAPSEEFYDRFRSEYQRSCRAESVPLPPDWPSARWISQGPLAFVFISQNLEAEVFAYKDPSVPGTCYALPRRDSSGSIRFLGIICQSATTGKACFWDNKTVDDLPITGPDINLRISEIGNGLTLGETCSNCHRGDNVFNIHPGTALDLSRDDVVGGPYQTDTAVRYTPMGQAHWSNPGPLTLPTAPDDESSCTSCHGLPEISPDYCRSVLRPAALVTMPAFGDTRAGWPLPPPGNVDPQYAEHIRFLSRIPPCPTP